MIYLELGCYEYRTPPPSQQISDADVNQLLRDFREGLQQRYQQYPNVDTEQLFRNFRQNTPPPPQQPKVDLSGFNFDETFGRTGQSKPNFTQDFGLPPQQPKVNLSGFNSEYNGFFDQIFNRRNRPKSD